MYQLLITFLVDCKWSQYDDWSNCSKPCGGGQRSTQIFIAQNAFNGGKECEGPSEKVEPCNVNKCPGT